MGAMLYLQTDIFATQACCFPLELVDEVMLHEMTHLKYMHHRKQFWDYFSLLLGKDAKLYKIKENEFFTKYDDMIEFLLK